MRIAISILLAALAADLAAQRNRPDPEAVWAKLAREHDKNSDGAITAAEYGRGSEPFKNLDRNGDGRLTRDDLLVAGKRTAGGLPRADESALPKPGDPAPDFELPLLADAGAADGKGKDGKPAPSNAPRKETTVKLGSFAGQKPVALIFGSYT
jgi:hypothetical protein